jgi:glycosyltransferase involved in cell wall biosynthesis
VSDPELERIYKACNGVIIASHAEGFGLPLIEALGHDKPVLARDLPIFRVHEDFGVRYFPADASPCELAACIRPWVKNAQAGRIQVVRPTASWKASAQGLLAAVL